MKILAVHPPDTTMPGALSFTVYGTPQPAGSKRAFGWKAKDGRSGVSVTDDNPKSRPWKHQVAQVAGEAMAGRPLFDGPLRVEFWFYRARPKGHRRPDGSINPKGQRTPYPDVRPDCTKLVRGAEDAMTGVVWTDDARIVHQTARKLWGEPARVEVTVEPMEAA